jgi:glycosyltransferase involved in cell wall biosynthesis
MSAAAPSPASAPELSVVVPVYFNEPNLPTSIPRLARELRAIVQDSFEIVCVDDGSRDRSLAVLEELQRDPAHRLRIVKLTRNFGSMSALQAGLEHARGAAVGMISADEQDPAELFREMHAHWRQGAKCVYAVRQDREEGFFGRLWASTFYTLLRRYALPEYPPGGFDFCLLDRQVVAALVQMQEKNTHLMNLVFWLGFPAVCLPYVRRARRAGRSRWTLAKKLKLFADSFVAFSYAPIRLVTLVGLVLFLAAMLYGGAQVYLRLVHGTPVPGFTTIVSLIALTSGIQMMMLGVLGEYLWRTLDATRRRPSYVVERIIEPTHG